MAKIVIDASSLVGALLKQGSVPEQALLLARASGTLCLSAAVDAEIRTVFARDKFRRYLTEGRIDHVLGLLAAAALFASPSGSVTDCCDAKDNMYLELALAAGAHVIISSDEDLLTLHPWRGIDILTPAAFVARFTQKDSQMP
jgi:putative PIN family toxin of toxin-antitoxin system